MKTSYSLQNGIALHVLCLLPLLLAACGTLEVDTWQTATPGAEVSMTGDVILTTRTAAPGTPIYSAAGPRPTPTSVLDGGRLSFNDAALGLALDLPLWWETDTTPGAITRFYQQDHTGARRNVLTLSVLNPESNTLESALEEVQQGAWGLYILEVQPIQLGAFGALRLDLSSRTDQPPVVWLVVAPSGRAVVLIPGGEGFAEKSIFMVASYEPDSQKLLIGTLSRGIFLYDGKAAVPFPTEADDYLKKNALYYGTRLPSSFSDGTPAKFAEIVYMSDKYIDKGSDALSPILNAVVGDVGVINASNSLKISSKSFLIKVLTF